MITEIRKADGIEQILDGIKPRELEELTIITPTSNAVQEALDFMNKMYEEVKDQHPIKSIQTIERLCINEENIPLLTPHEITAFLPATILYEHKVHYQFITGKALTSLIQKSYLAGNNGFVIKAASLPALSYVGDNLKGTPESPVQISAEIDLLNYSFRGCEYVECSIDSMGLGGIGSDSHYSHFIINVPTLEQSFSRIKHCSVRVNGLVQYGLEGCQDSQVIIDGELVEREKKYNKFSTGLERTAVSVTGGVV